MVKMTVRPNCPCGHNLMDHNDLWDTVEGDGKTPRLGVIEGSCRRCSCEAMRLPADWHEDNPAMKLYGTENHLREIPQ